MALTKDNDKEFRFRKRSFEQAKGSLQESREKEARHREEHLYGTSGQPLTIEQRTEQLREALTLNDENAVQRVIFELGAWHEGSDTIPDQIVEEVLTILREPFMYSSSLSGHVLNFFEFESKYLSKRQKDLGAAFLKAHGKAFTDPFSMQVVTELLHDDWLK